MRQFEQRFGLALLVAKLAGQGEHLLGGLSHLPATVLEDQRPAELAQDQGAQPRGSAGQEQRCLQVLDRPGQQLILAEHGAPQQQ